MRCIAWENGLGVIVLVQVSTFNSLILYLHFYPAAVRPSVHLLRSFLLRLSGFEVEVVERRAWSGLDGYLC